MRCPACLAEVIGSGKFCAACGTRIPQAVEAPSVPPPPQDPDDFALAPTDMPPPSMDTVDPFASTANPSASDFQAAAVVAAHAADAGRVSPLASSSFDLGADPAPISRAPIPAAGNPPPSLAPRSKHGSTVLLSALAPKHVVASLQAKAAPMPAGPVVPPAPAPVPARAPAPAAAPPSGYVAGPVSGYGAPPPSIAQAAPPSALVPGARVIVTFPNGQRVFGTIWQCAQAHVLIQFPDGKSQWVEIALVRSV